MAKSAAEPTKMEKMQDELIAADAAIMAQHAKERAKKGGGGKLSRTETVTVRLDPQLNYLCELAARAQRRTKSSFIEWAIENALTSVGIPGERKGHEGDLYTIADRNSDLWDVDEPDRLVALAYWAPSLLTHEEQIIWKIIVTSAYLWKGDYYDEAGEEVWGWETSKRWNLILDRLRTHWDEIIKVAEGEDPRDEYFALKTRLVRNKPFGGKPSQASAFDADLDDPDSDIPF